MDYASEYALVHIVVHLILGGYALYSCKVKLERTAEVLIDCRWGEITLA